MAGAGKAAPEEPKGPRMPDTSCNNKGLIFGAHPNKGGKAATTTPLDLNFVDGDAPAYLDSSTTLGLPNVNNIYGHSNTYDNIAVEHHGYFFAQEGGEYTFEASMADDYTLMW